jgi:hypothetical protein
MTQLKLEANHLRLLDRILKTDDEAECRLPLFNRQAQAGPIFTAAPQAVLLEALVTGILVDVKCGTIARFTSDEAARLISLSGLEAPPFPFEAPQLLL